MTRSALRLALLAALGVATLSACDSSPSDDVAAGQFEAAITGADTATLEGQAAYAVLTEDSQTVTSVGLLHEDDPQDVVVVIQGAPRTGTFQAGGDATAAEAGLLITLTDGETGAFYTSTAGTVTVSRAADGRLTGRFDIDAVSVSDPAQTVSVEGAFDASVGEADA